MNTLNEKACAPFQISNIRRFIAFRVFFNSRFYYPVFTVLFLDFGLSLEQFAILNAVWAATIVLFEVPSGALADIMGRRNLLITSSTIMVVEIALLCVVPPGKGTFLFIVFIVNRILSGLAEAFASGADEALAYDTLKIEGASHHWGRVLERQMRYRSIGFVVASVVGAALYDPQMVGVILHHVGIHAAVTQTITLKLPLYLTFIMAACTWITTLGMKEPNSQGGPRGESMCRPGKIHALRVSLQAGMFILRTPVAFAIILAGMMIDHVARMIITLASQYYRLIAIPEATFGIIGAALAMSGIFVPRIALWMSRRFSKTVNLWVVSGLTFFGILGMARFWPIVGLAPALVLFSAMMMAGFFISHYLNDITDSSQRATVLSFKGLCFNLAYGAIGIAYAELIHRLRMSPHLSGSRLAGPALEDAVFKQALSYFPYYFFLLFFLLMFFLFIRFRVLQKEPP